MKEVQWKWKYVTWPVSAEWQTYNEEVSEILERFWKKYQKTGESYYEFEDISFNFKDMKAIIDFPKNVERYGWERLWKGDRVRYIKRKEYYSSEEE